jgi:co-chaperonin GroES (HSP10)
MRDSENFIELPGEAGKVPEEAFDLFTALPGRFVILVDPVRQSHAGLILPDEVAAKTRPDAGTVIAVGPGVPLALGERILVRPYHGAWIEDVPLGGELRQVRLYGVTRPWHESALMAWRAEEWQPLADWVLLRREPNETTTSGIWQARPDSKPRRHDATVVRIGPGLRRSKTSSLAPGQHVLAENGPNAGLKFRFGELGDLELLKMHDEDGHLQIWSVVE